MAGAGVGPGRLLEAEYPTLNSYRPETQFYINFILILCLFLLRYQRLNAPLLVINDYIVVCLVDFLPVV